MTSMVVLLATLLVTLGIGTFAPDGVDAQGKVRILAVTSPETRGLKAVAAEFTKSTGIQVEFSEQGRLGYFESVITQLVAGSDAFDLAQINSTYVTELAAAGALELWDDRLNDPKQTNLAEYDLKDVPVIYRYQGKITMIPTDAMSQPSTTGAISSRRRPRRGTTSWPRRGSGRRR